MDTVDLIKVTLVSIINHEFSISPISGSPFRFQVLDFFKNFILVVIMDANFRFLSFEFSN